jgi:hypothetical protein
MKTIGQVSDVSRQRKKKAKSGEQGAKGKASYQRADVSRQEKRVKE